MWSLPGGNQAKALWNGWGSQDKKSDNVKCDSDIIDITKDKINIDSLCKFNGRPEQDAVVNRYGTTGATIEYYRSQGKKPLTDKDCGRCQDIIAAMLNNDNCAKQGKNHDQLKQSMTYRPSDDCGDRTLYITRPKNDNDTNLAPIVNAANCNSDTAPVHPGINQVKAMITDLKLKQGAADCCTADSHGGCVNIAVSGVVAMDLCIPPNQARQCVACSRMAHYAEYFMSQCQRQDGRVAGAIGVSEIPGASLQF